MKKNKAFVIAVVLTMIVTAACDKTEESSIESIEGTYVGTLTSGNSLKSASNSEIDAKAEITKTTDGQIEVHCYGGELDTIFMLHYYENHDSVMVCLNGDAFEHMYGHMTGQGHLMGGMMGGISGGETQWQHHMSDEHKEGDQHPGGFDMQHRTFRYQFQMMDGEIPYKLTFQGIKQ